MNTNPRDPNLSNLTPAEKSLRLIASLPAPDGLENRVNAALSVVQTAARRRGRVLAWPRTLGLTFRPESSWMRTAAAAAGAFILASSPRDPG